MLGSMPRRPQELDSAYVCNSPLAPAALHLPCIIAKTLPVAHPVLCVFSHACQAHAFQEGLKLNPTDKSLRQGFWDAVALVSQSRTDQATANLDFSIAAAQAQQQQFGLARVAEGDE